MDPSKANLSGKAVFMTGGSKGLDRSMALSFAKVGASRMAVGARFDMSQLAKDVEAAAVSAARSAPKMLLSKLDVTNGKSVEKTAAEIVKEFGKLDVLVNNAGVLGHIGMIVDSKPEKWWEVLDVNCPRGILGHSRLYSPLLLKGTDDKSFSKWRAWEHISSIQH